MQTLTKTNKETVKITNTKVQKFIDRILNPFTFKFFLFFKLPMGFLASLKVKELTTKRAEVTVPYRWLTQNPFRSTYFAVLAMAGEMSTGVLAMAATEGSKHPISMLVVGMESSFVKKATGITTFTCENGEDFFRAVDFTEKTGEAVTIQSTTIGRNPMGEEVARFNITWSMKKKSKKK